MSVGTIADQAPQVDDALPRGGSDPVPHLLGDKFRAIVGSYIFGRGYKAGFDRALRIMTHHAWKVNDPAARIGILNLALRFERVRCKMASDDDGNIRTLRARKFAI